MKRLLALLFAGFAVCNGVAHAHLNNKDVYQTVDVNGHKLFITVRTPTVIPGVATIEVRVDGVSITSLTETPLLLTGEASKHPPTAEAMQRDANDPQLFTGTLWIMGSGSWQVRFVVDGKDAVSVPVPAVSTEVLTMQRPLGLLLSALCLLLVIGVVGIIAAAVREARLPPGAQPDTVRRKRAVVASAGALLFAMACVASGLWWWGGEAADYRAELHRNSEMRPTLAGNQLSLLLGDPDKTAQNGWHVVSNKDLLPDHGKLMHLYAIRWPEMDAVFHLHPVPTGKRGLSMTLPAMPAGDYKLFADVVFSNGFPETETAMLTVPASVSAATLAEDDAAAIPAPLSAAPLGADYKLPDGYTMHFDAPIPIEANHAYVFRFTLLDASGKPAADGQPYLGMAGHAAFVKTDGTAFAHTHPDGTSAMASMMLAEASTGGPAAMDGMEMAPRVEPSVGFPYGFPSAGRYRVFVQMKHGATVETGVFDVEVR